MATQMNKVNLKVKNKKPNASTSLAIIKAALSAENGRRALLANDWRAEEFPIFEFVHRGEVKKVEEQLKASYIEPKTRTTFNHSLLTLAATCKNHAASLEVVKLLFTTFKKRIKAFDIKDHSEALSIAILEKNVDFALYLIQEGANATGVSMVSKTTPLMAAVIIGNLELVEKLIPISNLDAVDKDGCSALIHAAMKGRSISKFEQTEFDNHENFVSVVSERNKQMVQNQMQPQAQSQFGKLERLEDSVLSEKLARERKRTEEYYRITCALLNHHAIPNLVNRDGRNALMYAVRTNDMIVERLLQEKRVVDAIDHIANDGVTAALMALLSNKEHLFFKCVQAGANPTVIGKSIMQSALSVATQINHNIEVVKCIIRHMSLEEINQPKLIKGFPALIAVLDFQWPECAELLIDKGAAVDVRVEQTGDSALHYLVLSDILLPHLKSFLSNIQSQPILKRELLNSVNKEGISPLTLALKYNAIEIVKALLLEKVDLHQKYKGFTPLMVAAQVSNPAIFDLILTAVKEQGGNLEDKDSYGGTALLVAICAPRAISDKKEIVAMLLKSKVEVNLQFSSSYNKGKLKKVLTPLLSAAELGLGEIIQLLLENGADVDFENKEGDTALSFAASSKNLETVQIIFNKMLQKKDLNKFILAEKVFKALQVAAGYDAVEVFDYLLKQLEGLERNSAVTQVDNQEDIQKNKESQVLLLFKNICMNNESPGILDYFLKNERLFTILKQHSNDLLVVVMRENNLAMADWVLQKLGADINYKIPGLNFNLLMSAIKNESLDTVEFLLKRNIDLEPSFDVEIEVLPADGFGNPVESDEETFSAFDTIHFNWAVLQAAYSIAKHSDNNLKMAALILTKKMLNQFVGAFQDKLKSITHQINVVELRNKMLEFSTAFCRLTLMFFHQGHVAFPKDTFIHPQDDSQTPTIVIITFAEVLNIFLKIYTEHNQKGKNFNYERLMQYILKYHQEIIKEQVLEEKDRADMLAVEQNVLESNLDYTAAFQQFPNTMVGVAINIFYQALHFEGTIDKRPGIFKRIDLLLNESNQFLHSFESLSKKQKPHNLSHLKQKNLEKSKLIKNIKRNISESHVKHSNLQVEFVDTYLKAAALIKQKLEKEGLEAAKGMWNQMNQDPNLQRLKEMATSQLNDILIEVERLSDLEKELEEQREREKAMQKTQIKRQQKQEVVARMESERLVEEERQKADQIKVDELLQEKLIQDQKILAENRARLNKMKEAQRQYARDREAARLASKQAAKEEELKRKQEHTQDKKPEKDRKQIQEPRHLQRKRLFAHTLARKTDFELFFRLTPEAFSLHQVLMEINQFSDIKQLENNQANLLVARNACLALTARMAELIFKNNGMGLFNNEVEKKALENFRDVIWHGEKAVIAKFKVEEILEMTKLIGGLVFGFLTGKKKRMLQSHKSLQSNAVFNTILTHDLKEREEPFQDKFYLTEYKLDKEEQAQYASCTFEPSILEHACGYSGGRQDAFAKRIFRYYPKVYRDHQQQFDFDMKQHYESETSRLCLTASFYRHAETESQSLTMLNSMFGNGNAAGIEPVNDNQRPLETKAGVEAFTPQFKSKQQASQQAPQQAAQQAPQQAAPVAPPGTTRKPRKKK